MKKKLPKFLILVIIMLSAIVIYNLISIRNLSNLITKPGKGIIPQDIANKYSPAPTSLPTPSPKPLTFEELNNLYGPCVHLPVLYYHHIQNMDVAKAAGQQNLTVATDIFINQMQYLKTHGYSPVNTNTLTDFFDKGIPIPAKSIILTFDDGYEDFYVNVLPLMQQLGFKAVMALPTGLVGNPGYLTWDEVNQIAGANIEIVNHTWSHASLGSSNHTLIEKEIGTADQQLSSRGLNQNKVFVYPYGSESDFAISFLQSKGYTLAFNTIPGSTLCKKQRLSLPRIRIGNVGLSAYGF